MQARGRLAMTASGAFSIIFQRSPGHRHRIGRGKQIVISGNSWAQGFNVSTCAIPRFNSLFLDTELAEYSSGGENDGIVGIRANYNGGNSEVPYFIANSASSKDWMQQILTLTFFIIYYLL